MTELQKAIIDKVKRLSVEDMQLLMVIMDRLLIDNETHQEQPDQNYRLLMNYKLLLRE